MAKFTKKWLLAFVALTVAICCAFGLAACGGDPVAVESVTLNKTTLELEEGETEQLTATVSPDNAEDKTVTWTSSDDEVATVSDSGLVTAIAEGEATITATAGGKSATCAVKVIFSSLTPDGDISFWVTLAPEENFKPDDDNPDPDGDNEMQAEYMSTTVAFADLEDTVTAGSYLIQLQGPSLGRFTGTIKVYLGDGTTAVAELNFDNEYTATIEIGEGITSITFETAGSTEIGFNVTLNEK